jgi:site-specific DNA recombinase
LPKGENRGKALNRANRPRFLFSGMVTCGICGGGMSMISATHLGCSRARNKGVCDNRKSMARTRLETRVLDALATRLMDPALFAVFCQAFIEETNRLRHAVRSQAEDRERELGKIRRDLDRLVQAILDGTPARAIQDRITTLEARRTELEAAPRVDAAAPPIVHPAMAKIYRDKVADLAKALTAPDTRIEAAEILRSLIDAIELHPGKAGYDVLLRGDLAGILQLGVNGKKPAAISGDGLLQVALVAGVGFEPTTFRL